MASASRSLDTDILQIRKVFARTPQNGYIPSSHILIANGDGSTSWNSVSSIMPVSSFGIVCGNSSAVKLYGDLSFNLLQISTTGVGNIFQSYVDPVSKVLMLSNTLPPFGVSESVPAITSNAAFVLPNAEYLIPQTGLSTIKFLGVNDLKISSITSQNAMFFSISTFTSAGYQAISGETFQWRPTLYSTISTTAGFANFTSSIGVIAPVDSLVDIPMTQIGADLYFSSMTFSANHLMRYLDTHTTNSTRMFVELNPTFLFESFVNSSDNQIKEMSTYLQIETVASGRVLFQESINTKYVTSQIFENVTSISNYFNTPIRMEINPYNIASNVNINAPNTVNIAVYHRLVNSSASFSGFNRYTNRSAQGLYVQMMNNPQLYP